MKIEGCAQAEGSATGWDRIPSKILKVTAKGIAPSLTRLFNTIIEKGQWPSSWKMEQWTPVFRKGDRTDPCNYRPITVLNSVDKVFESLLYKQVTATMDSHLYYKMTAYRNQHSLEPIPKRSPIIYGIRELIFLCM